VSSVVATLKSSMMVRCRDIVLSCIVCIQRIMQSLREATTGFQLLTGILSVSTTIEAREGVKRWAEQRSNARLSLISFSKIDISAVNNPHAADLQRL
jgi:hypothetical protein